MLKELQPAFGFEENVDFIEAGYLDSFDIIQLISMLESGFGVLISALEIVPENFSSVETIKIYMRSAQKSAKSKLLAWNAGFLTKIICLYCAVGAIIPMCFHL